MLSSRSAATPGHARRSRQIGIGAVLALALSGAAVPLASPASAVVPNDPPGNNHSILSFPVRDFISADGYLKGDLVTVEILRSGVVVGTAPNLVPTDDPGTAGFDGIVEVNHPGGGCWTTVTPDIRAGDVVRMTTASGQVDQTHVADVTVTQPATNVGGTIVEKGTAAGPTGAPLPADQLQARIIANRLTFDVNGKRDLRAPGQGTIAYDAPGSTSWTATWTGLDQHDQDQAVAGESRGLWLGTNPLATTTLGSPVESTLYEFGALGGPAAPCTAPLATGPTTPDMTPATDTGASATDDITSNPSPSFTGVTGLAPAGSTVNLYVDGAVNGTALAGAGGAYSLTPASPLTDGPHSIKASEVSASGVETLSAAALSVTVDTAAPAAPAVTSVSPASPGRSTSPQVGGTAEAGSTVSLFTDTACSAPAGAGGSAAAFGTGIGVAVTPGSTTSFTATATDVAGNVSSCSTSSISYAQDSVPPPTPTIDAAPASPTNSNAPSFGFSDTETGVTFTCSLTTGADSFTPCTSPQTYTAQPDGTYTLKVAARDAAGNISTATRSLTIDTTLPTVTLTSRPADPTNNTSPTFAYASEPGSTFACSMTTGPDSFAPCTSPATFTALADGRYTFKVVATDAAGNVGAPTLYPVTIDTVAPGASITGFPPATTSDNTPTFDFASADTSAKFSCSLTLATATLDNFQACSSPLVYPARANGNWVFKVRATDAAGNIGVADTYAFTINTVVATPAVTLSPTSLAFPSTAVGTAATTKTVTLTNSGTAGLTVSSIAVGGVNAADFTQTHPTCGATLAAGASCTINVAFKPTAVGSRTASLSVADSATGSPHTVALTGAGATGDTTPPTISARSPLASATGVAVASKVTATFSEAVTGLSGTTFTLKNSAGTAVTATVGYDLASRVATLTPSAALAANTTYTATLTGGSTAIHDMANNPLTTATWSFTTAAGTTDITAPSISARTPGVNGTGASQTANLTATFSEAVSGVSAATFTVKNAATGAAVGATSVAYNATTRVATFDPNVTLTADTRYTASLSTAIKDTAGNALPATSWTFTTGPVPTVSARTPGVNGTGASQTANLTVTFSEAVSGVSAATFTVKNAATGAAVGATSVAYNATTRVATFDPNVTLTADTRYTASLSTAIKDTAGNALPATSWTFTTGPAPTVVARTPAVNATSQSRTGNVTATFSEAVTGTSGTTMTLKDTAGVVQGAVVSYNATTRVVTLNPNATLLASTKYLVTLTTGIKDTAGNALPATTWSFTTGTT